MPKLSVIAEHRAVRLGLRFLVAGVLVAAAVPKLADLPAFSEQVRNYRVLGEGALLWVTALVPSLELAAAAALLLSRWALGGAAVAVGLFVGFSVAIAQAIARDLNIDCGCFGSAASASASGTALLRNGALILAGAGAFFLEHRARGAGTRTDA